MFYTILLLLAAALMFIGWTLREREKRLFESNRAKADAMMKEYFRRRDAHRYTDSTGPG
jgi:hypothetical protein